MRGLVALVVSACVSTAWGCASKEARLAQRTASGEWAAASEMCQWPESDNRTLNPKMLDDRVHLSNDLRVVQTRARLAATQALDPGDRRFSSLVDACASQLRAAASRAHGVTEAQLRESQYARAVQPSMLEASPGWGGFPPADSH